MKIFIDADASPVRKHVVKLAKHYDIELIIISNYNHEIHEDYGTHIIVDSGPDVADHEIIKRLEEKDLVITQDYGLASLVLGKHAYALHQDGWFFTNDNIDMLLMRRHMNQKLRRANKKTPLMKKRKEKDNKVFVETLDAFLKNT